MTTDAIEKHLATEFEGKLFVDIGLLKIGNTYTISKFYYTVECGRCYLIEGKMLHPTGDTMLSVKTDCKMVGKYNPNKYYNRSMRDYSYSEFKKLHKL